MQTQGWQEGGGTIKRRHTALQSQRAVNTETVRGFHPPVSMDILHIRKTEWKD